MRSAKVGIDYSVALPFPQRRPQGGGYRMSRYPRVPPRLARIFPGNPVYFVTLCTYRRRKLLTTAAVYGGFVRFAERAYAEQNIAVGRYVIMPDHIHLFVTGPDDFALGRWVGLLKQVLQKSIETSSRDPIWQRGFFDHILRSEESYGQKWNYVRNNPVRAGLVANAEDWLCAGEIITIDRL
jgi:putative transposase